MQEEQARKILESRELTKYTSQTVTDIDGIIRGLQGCGFGYAACINEHEEYVSSVACPVRDYTGKLCCAISAGGISEIFNNIGLRHVAEKTKTATDEISRALGYRPK